MKAFSMSGAWVGVGLEPTVYSPRFAGLRNWPWKPDSSADSRPLRRVIFQRQAESYRWSQHQGLHKTMRAFSISGAWSVVRTNALSGSPPHATQRLVLRNWVSEMHLMG